MKDENEVLEGEIVEPETEDDTEDDSETLFVTGFNETAIVKPVKCGACDMPFYAKLDDIGEEDADGDIPCEINFCPYCGTDITAVNAEF